MIIKAFMRVLIKVTGNVSCGSALRLNRDISVSRVVLFCSVSD